MKNCGVPHGGTDFMRGRGKAKCSAALWLPPGGSCLREQTEGESGRYGTICVHTIDLYQPFMPLWYIPPLASRHLSLCYNLPPTRRMPGHLPPGGRLWSRRARQGPVAAATGPCNGKRGNYRLLDLRQMCIASAAAISSSRNWGAATEMRPSARSQVVLPLTLNMPCSVTT